MHTHTCTPTPPCLAASVDRQQESAPSRDVGSYHISPISAISTRATRTDLVSHLRPNSKTLRVPNTHVGEHTHYTYERVHTLLTRGRHTQPGAAHISNKIIQLYHAAREYEWMAAQGGRLRRGDIK